VPQCRAICSSFQLMSLDVARFVVWRFVNKMRVQSMMRAHGLKCAELSHFAQMPFSEHRASHCGNNRGSQLPLGDSAPALPLHVGSNARARGKAGGQRHNPRCQCILIPNYSIKNAQNLRRAEWAATRHSMIRRGKEWWVSSK
jgi:hypothetical protein